MMMNCGQALQENKSFNNSERKKIKRNKKNNQLSGCGRGLQKAEQNM